MKTSSDPRHLSRKVAMSVIFAFETTDLTVNKDNALEIADTACDSLGISQIDQGLLEILLNEIVEKKESTKQLIAENSKDWELQKIYKTDLSVLILAILEIGLGKVPIKVVIDEAVELAKEFGQEESPKFVNGVLAGVVSKMNKDAN